jgi:muramoyltetrapeptide carboxypeptidase
MIPYMNLPALAGDDRAIVKLKPAVLKNGDTVGIIAPGTSVSDPDDLQRAKDALNHFGLKAKWGKNLEKGSGYKSRSIKERADDLHSMFEDKEVNAVFCIRGGYGTSQILPYINFELIKQNPKIFLGYSDITALHLAINKMTGLVTFHGPVVLSTFTGYTEENFQKALFNPLPIGELKNPGSKNNFRAVHPVRTIVTGKASGEIAVGNLSLICSLMGTPYELDTSNKILMLEDVGEEPYRIDRMLTQLNLSGKLKKAAGIIIGESAGCNSDGLQPSRVWDYSFGEIIDQQLSNLGVPVFFGLTFGHTSDQLTIPFGLSAEMDADKGTLTITENAFSI